MPNNASQKPVHQDLVDAVTIPTSIRDTSIGDYFSALAARVAGVKNEDLVLLENCFKENKAGKKVLHLHSPLVEAVLWDLIEQPLRDLVARTVTERKRQEEEEESE